MKHKSLTVLLLLLAGCLPNKDPGTKIGQEDSKVAQAEYSPYEQIPEGVILPEGFTVDSVVYLDEDYNISYLMEIPTLDFPAFSTHVDARIRMIKQELNKRIEERQQEMKKKLVDEPIVLKGELSRTYSFDCYPQSAYQDSTSISIRCRSTWYEGGPHGLPQYLTINFDKQTGSEITFEDYFQLHSVQDSQKVVALVNEGLRNPDLSISEVYSMKFNIEGDSVSFNFDAYELESYAYGMPRACVAKADLGSLIHEKYR